MYTAVAFTYRSFSMDIATSVSTALETTIPSVEPVVRLTELPDPSVEVGATFALAL